jgi:hypothetical protein
VWRKILSAGLALGLGGCISGPMIENPAPIRFDQAQASAANPGFVPQSQSPAAYARVFSRCLDVVSDYFVIDAPGTSRYAGIIRTFPQIAPGIEQPWKPGSPDFYQRLLAFTQTIRHRAIVEITTGQDGGYFVEVKVFKELEDIPAPSRATAGEATYRQWTPLERQFSVIDIGQFESNWIPIGRDPLLEQVILERITRLDTPHK